VATASIGAACPNPSDEALRIPLIADLFRLKADSDSDRSRMIADTGSRQRFHGVMPPDLRQAQIV
jgi:hypothetical protein